MSSRRRFGSVRKLPSGRWQARYHDAAGNRFTAPETFPTKTEAHRWLSSAETDMGRGDWHDPRLADLGFDDWAERWMAIKTPQLAPSTVVLYRYLLRTTSSRSWARCRSGGSRPSRCSAGSPASTGHT